MPSLKIGSFIGMLIVALFWNGLLSIFVLAVFTTGALTGFMTAFMIPFILIGLFLIGLALKQFLAMFNPRVELTINQAQSSPGDTLHISWQINGSLDRLKKLRILLAGEEVAVYRRGTNMVTDRHEFQNIQVYESDAISGIGAAKVEIPRDAMHSFRARSNSIVWKLRVRGEVPRWPDIEADYEILVVPPGVTRG